MQVLSFLRKGLWVTFGQIAAIILSMIAGIVTARSLGPNGMGQYELFRSTEVMAVTLFALGIGNATIYFLNNQKIETVNVVTNTFKVSVIQGIFLSIGLAAGILIYRNYFGHVSKITSLWFGIAAAFHLSMLLLQPVLIAQLDATRMVVINVIPRVIVLIATVPLMLINRLNTEMAISILALGNVGACVMTVYYLREHLDLKMPFDWSLVKSILNYGIKLAAVNLLYVFSLNITVMLMRYLWRGDFHDIGLYTRAVAISGMVTVIPTAIAPLLYAKWADVKGIARARQGEMAMRMNVTFGIIACLGLLIAGKLVIRLLYGGSFMGANQALQILAPSLVLMTMYSVCNSMLSADGRAMITAYILTGTLFVIGITTWFAVPIMGIRGTALAVLIGNAFTAISSLILCRKLYGIRPHKCMLVNSDDLRYIVKAIIPSRIRASLSIKRSSYSECNNG